MKKSMLNIAIKFATSETNIKTYILIIESIYKVFSLTVNCNLFQVKINLDDIKNSAKVNQFVPGVYGVLSNRALTKYCQVVRALDLRTIPRDSHLR